MTKGEKLAHIGNIWDRDRWEKTTKIKQQRRIGGDQILKKHASMGGSELVNMVVAF